MTELSAARVTITPTAMPATDHAITLGDLRHLVHLTGRDLRECVDQIGEDHQYTRNAIRLHAFLSALAAQDKITEGYRREVFLALGPAPEPLHGGAS